MEYVYAFAIAGIFCVFAQIFAMITKLDPGKILIIAIAIAGILTLTGTLMPVASLGGWGYKCIIFGAGTAIVKYTQLCMAGNPLPFILFLGLVVTLVIVGIIAGEVRHRKSAESTE